MARKKTSRVSIRHIAAGMSIKYVMIEFDFCQGELWRGEATIRGSLEADMVQGVGDHVRLGQR
jgi:hypothetical protein